MISLQLLQQRRRQKHPQLAAGAAEDHGEARLERVAQLAEDDAVHVGAQLRQRHRGARAVRAAVGDNARHFFMHQNPATWVGPSATVVV